MANRKAEAQAEAARQIEQLRAVAENPLVRPSVRIEARRALKALLPRKIRVIGQTTRAGRDWVHDDGGAD